MRSTLAGKKLNWESLQKLRDKFLREDFKADYWLSDEDLLAYDQTYAERIAWKWESVWRELRQRQWVPPVGTLLDWGCGTGVASRTALEAHPSLWERACLSDHSARARAFAGVRLRQHSPALQIAEEDWRELRTRKFPEGLTLLLSHVLNELKPAVLEDLLLFIEEKATAVLWLEPGLKSAGQKLPRIRERLLAQFRAVAPCTHQVACQMIGRERDWCHHFAKVPPEIFQDSDWMRFGKDAGVDLRRLPYSFLVLDRRAQGATTDETDLTRMIGEARHYKGYSKLLGCDRVRGIRELMLQKRDAPELLNDIKDQSKNEGPALFRFVCVGDKIVSGERR